MTITHDYARLLFAFVSSKCTLPRSLGASVSSSHSDRGTSLMSAELFECLKDECGSKPHNFSRNWSSQAREGYPLDSHLSSPQNQKSLFRYRRPISPTFCTPSTHCCARLPTVCCMRIGFNQEINHRGFCTDLANGSWPRDNDSSLTSWLKNFNSSTVIHSNKENVSLRKLAPTNDIPRIRDSPKL